MGSPLAFKLGGQIPTTGYELVDVEYLSKKVLSLDSNMPKRKQVTHNTIGLWLSEDGLGASPTFGLSVRSPTP